MPLRDRTVGLVSDASRGDMDPRQMQIFERLSQGRGRIPTPYKVWIHSPEAAEGMEIIGTHLNNNSTLSEIEIEIAILLTAKVWEAAYVLNNHLRHGRNAGLDDETLECLTSGIRPVFADEHTQAVHDFTAVALSAAVPSDEEFEHYERVLGRKGIAEILILVGYYTSVSLAMKVHRVTSAESSAAIARNNGTRG
jgi:4-carboxymuconolactone decarboxylase